MLAVYFGLKIHDKALFSSKHVKVLVDNTSVQITLIKWEPVIPPFLTVLSKRYETGAYRINRGLQLPVYPAKRIFFEANVSDKSFIEEQRFIAIMA